MLVAGDLQGRGGPLSRKDSLYEIVLPLEATHALVWLLLIYSQAL